MKKEKKENQEKTDECIDEIFGAFVRCGQPIIEGNELIKWKESCVRLDTIKSIHDETRYCRNEGCIFYTYKDEWYICRLSVPKLTFEINKYLMTGTSHGSERTGDNTRRDNMRQATEYLSS